MKERKKRRKIEREKEYVFNLNSIIQLTGVLIDTQK